MESEQTLFERFIRNECTRQEIGKLLAQFENAANEAGLREMILERLNNEEEPASPQLPDLEEKEEIIYAALMPHLKEKRTVRLWPRIAAAASILLFLSIGGYYIFHKQPAQQTVRLLKNDIAPGHYQATLTLSNGKKIILTKGLSGLLAQQGHTQINISQNNIIYDAKNQTGDQISYNTLSTARGEQSPYPLVLADGTKVWLNAESSITFPTEFNGAVRIVKITGEAYFEAVHNDKQPFKVQTDKETIEDIGTHFDVNAYADETHRTTLIEGAVKVNGTLIKPGEQAIIANNSITVKKVNTGQFIAWKNGDFDFENDQITTVMHQLSRWYDIDVNYQGPANTEGFHAQISRHQNISVILQALERTNGVHFKIEGRRVTIIQ
jgi:transmembrane sensor